MYVVLSLNKVSASLMRDLRDSIANLEKLDDTLLKPLMLINKCSVEVLNLNGQIDKPFTDQVESEVESAPDCERESKIKLYSELDKDKKVLFHFLNIVIYWLRYKRSLVGDFKNYRSRCKEPKPTVNALECCCESHGKRVGLICFHNDAGEMMCNIAIELRRYITFMESTYKQVRVFKHKANIPEDIHHQVREHQKDVVILMERVIIAAQQIKEEHHLKD